MNLKLLYKPTYGNDRYFPLDAESATILKLMNRLTFNPKDILIMRDANWKIEIVPWTKEMEWCK